MVKGCHESGFVALLVAVLLVLTCSLFWKLEHVRRDMSEDERTVQAALTEADIIRRGAKHPV